MKTVILVISVILSFISVYTEGQDNVHPAQKTIACRNFHSISENTGMVFQLIDTGEKDKAKQYCRLLSSKKDTASRISSWSIRGYLNLTDGNYDSSILCFVSALRLAEAFRCPEGQNEKGIFLRKNHHLLGMAYEMAGRWNRALNSYEMALELSRPEDSVYKTILLLNIGSVYQTKGDLFFAKQYVEEAIRALERTKGEEVMLAYACNNLATILIDMQEYAGALDLLEHSYDLLSGNFQDNHPEMGHYYYNKAEACLGSGSAGKAMSNLRQAEEVFNGPLYRYPGETTKCAILKGKVYEVSGADDSARLQYRKCLEMQNTQFPRCHPEIAHILNALGDLHRKEGNFLEAQKNYWSAIEANLAGVPVEDLMQEADLLNFVLSPSEMAVSLAGLLLSGYEGGHSQEEITLFRKTIPGLLIATLNLIGSSHHSIESSYFSATKTKNILGEVILSLCRQDLTENADPKLTELLFNLIESSKANTLLKLMANSTVREEYLLPDSLIDHEQQMAGEKDRLLSRLNTMVISGEDATSPEAISLKSQIFHLSCDIKDTRLAIDSIISTFHINQIPVTPAFTDIKDALAPGEVIVEYTLIDTLLLTMILKQEGLWFSKAANPGLEDKISSLRQAISLANTKDFAQNSEQLFNILVKPISHLLNDVHRLIIIPDESLFTLPFETLITGGQPYPGGFLISFYEVSYAFSSSSWYHLKCGPAWTGIEQIRNFAAFAPVFSGRFPMPGQSLKSLDTSTLRAFLGRDGYIRELPFSGQEVDSISKILAGCGIYVNKYLNHTATEANFKSELARTDIIHVATHGFASREHGLSGLIFFQDGYFNTCNDSAVIDDGILYPLELDNTGRSNRLVILSSCESGLGKTVSGEGIVSLAHGFLSSGTENVIISLWKISDIHTLEFMKFFYRRLVDGLSPSAALRSAKLRMLEERKTSLPKLWAPFIIYGQ